ncbi:MAG: L,D-transpeptidase family protein, partial [Pseudorhodoplanes sp.]
TAGYASAQSMTPAQVEAAVPVPEAANVPPPTAADVEAKPAAPAMQANTAAQPPAASQSASATAQSTAEPAKTEAATKEPAAKTETTASVPAPQPGEAGKAAEAVKEAPKENAAAKETPATPVAATPTNETPAVAAENPVNEKLRELVTTKLSKFFDRKTERDGVTAFYTARNFAPIWADNGLPNARANAAMTYLKGVAAEGLDPADYPLPDFAKATTPEAQAEAEMRLTDSVLTFARHAQIGRVHYSRVSADILYNLVAPEPVDVLAKLAKADDVGAALASYNPPHPQYKALKAKLAEARARKSDAGPVRIDNGPVLKITRTKAKKGQPAENVFMEDSRVPQLRERLGLAADAGNTTYDAALADAVKAFQAKHGLRANGQLTQATVNALNGPRRDRDADIILVNMERWRWVPRDLGRNHVVLNIPDFTLRVESAGKLVWATRVVTGKPGRMATPMLSETIKYITVNPTWNVPPSIINNEYLPALQQDPGALERIGLKVTQNNDGSIRIYQPPGERNALGRLRFNFPNKFLVYQHDTPDKHLFAHDKRAYSHGCMRVQNPDKYAEVLLGLSQPAEGWTVERIRKMYGNSEQNINLAKPIPVHITYQTAFVDDAGHLQIRDDVYGRDAPLLAALKGDDRRNADVAIARSESSTTTVRKDVNLPDSVFSGGRRSGRYASSEGGFSFFERLFGGGRESYGPPPSQGRRVYR